MAGWIAQDTFVAESPDGAWIHVQKGAAFPDDHPVVALDRAAAEQAAKDGISRTPLFAPMNFGEPEPEPEPEPKAKAPAKPAASRKGT